MLVSAIRKLYGDISVPKFSLEVPENPEHGDYATNIAMVLAKTLKKNPMSIAEEIANKLSVASYRVKIAPPGFINFYLSEKILYRGLAEILKKQKNYGKKQITGNARKKINVEFVSANPTGPLTMANGRGGFYGDVLANILEANGHKVTREYYINDTGNQIKLLGESILAELGIREKRDEHYKGEYIKKYADSIREKWDFLKKRGFTEAIIGGVTVDLEKNEILKVENPEIVGKIAKANNFNPIDGFLNEIKQSLEKAGIKYDVWFSEEKNLQQKGELKKTLEFLEKKGLVGKHDGAVWLGDAVLVKSDQNPTYFLSDLAYHCDKLIKRKFDIAIDIWGADHYGHVDRTKKGVAALGVDPARLHIIIMQLVRLVRGGKEVKMSKRAGEFVTLDELLDEVGIDAARYFFLERSPDTHMDFNLDLAKERSVKNPVYYIQYAHARISAIFRKASILCHPEGAKQPKDLKRSFTSFRMTTLRELEELVLIKKLIKFPEVIEDITKDYQVHHLTHYAYELARSFHNFYEKRRVITDDKNLTSARLTLAKATQIVLQITLDLLGIKASERM